MHQVPQVFTPVKIITSIPCLLSLVAAQGTWKNISHDNDPIARHECSYVQAGEHFFLMGGRETDNINQFDYKTGKWSVKAAAPTKIHHFQATEYHGLILAVCALTGNYPAEPPLPNVYLYDPLQDKWVKGPEVPKDRQRGSTGVVVHDDRIYIVAGNNRGHQSGWKPWFDSWDPTTNTWTVLTDAPRARDHFHAVLAGNKIYALAGRRSSQDKGSVFANTIPEVDVYDISTKKWTTLPAADNLPTPRAAAVVGLLAKEIIVAGGESMSTTGTHSENEALNIDTHKWRTLQPMTSSRHGSQGIVSNGGLYVAAGSPTRGGAKLASQVAFFPGEVTAPKGTPILPGKLKWEEAEIIIDASRKSEKQMFALTLGIASGNQAVYLEKIVTPKGIAVSGVTLPILVIPGKSTTIKLEYTPGQGTPDAGEIALHSLIPKTEVAGKIPVSVGNTVALARFGSKRRAVSFERHSMTTVSRFFLASEQAATFQIVGLNGEVLYLERFSGRKGLNTITVPRLHLPWGKYGVKVVGDSEQISQFWDGRF